MLDAMLRSESESATSQAGTTNAFGVAGSLDQHLTNAYSTTQNITNRLTQLNQTFVDNFSRDVQVSESVANYVSKFEQIAKVGVSKVSAAGPVVINVNLSQFTVSISSLVSELNVASKYLSSLKSFDGFVIDSSVYADAASTNTTNNTQTGTAEGASAVLTSATPWGVLGSASTKIIFAVSVVIVLFLFVFLGINGRR